MDRLRKARRPLRAAVTRITGTLEQELAKENPDHQILRIQMDHLNDIYRELEEMDGSIKEQLLDDNCTDEEQDAEFVSIEEYGLKWRTIRAKVASIIETTGPESRRTRSESPTASEGSFNTAASGNEKKRNFKLPKIELKKFSGNLTEWLGWWAQFSKIHEDESLHASDKFQYLVGCMVKDSKAEDLVKAYPLSEENYPKVVTALKERFGKKELQQEVYVREMLKLVISNAKDKDKIPLSKMFILLESHLRSLESLGISHQQMGQFLYPMVESSLPEDTLIAWQRSSNFGRDDSVGDVKKGKLDYLLEFLRREVQNEEQRSLVRGGFTTTGEKKDGRAKVKKDSLFSSNSEDIPTVAGLHIGQSHCIFCPKSHPSQECFKALALTLEDRRAAVAEKKGCYICLKPGHMAKACRAQIKCTGCSRKHYHIMCPENDKKKKDNVPVTVDTAAVQSNFVRNKLILLKTLVAKLMTPKGPELVRMLFDDGSQKSYVRSNLAKEARSISLGKTLERNSLFGGVLTDIKERNIFKMKFHNVEGTFCKDLQLLDQPRIATNIPRIPWGPWSEELKRMNIMLSDCDSSSSEEIDVLIGSDLMPQLLTGRILKLKCGLLATETLFGWTLMGPVNCSGETTAMIVTSMHVCDASVSQLWELDAIGIQDPSEHKTKSEKEAEVKQHFLDTISRGEDGRYCVSLPWIGGVQKIPENLMIAKKRLESTTQKLKKDGMYAEYNKIFRSWVEEGFIEEIENKDYDEKPCHYLPHRAVYKPTSTTTPVRPVFDASCKVGRYPSLNDCLEKGPNFIELIPSIMLRFRANNIGVVADIRKAFQMIGVNERDQDFLRFVWWEDEKCENLKIFKHKRVVFGVNCSPFLLGAVLDYHISQIQDQGLARSLLNSFYVDNLVTSLNSKEDVSKYKEQATEIMASAKMELRQWEYGPVEESEIGPLRGCGLDYDREPAPMDSSFISTTVLGMKWNKVNDTLSCETVPEIPEKITKRSLLSTIQKIYDPMGFVSPAMILPKRILQESWSQKMKWDDELPDEAKNTFHGWIKEIKCLEDIHIPRNMSGGCSWSENWQLHIFCDASKYAYAAIVYLRVELGNRVSVQMLQSKARVAPLKNISIPRLELLGCSIAARLSQSVQKALSLEIPTFYWSDSTTALAWIHRNDEWGTFVGNRVREICTLSRPEDWRHVPGALNPADLPSRGCTPGELLQSKWWEGPQWLKLRASEWPHAEVDEDEGAITSEKKGFKPIPINMNNVTEVPEPWYATKFSSYVSCVRVMGWILRFISKTRGKTAHGELSSEEVNVAEQQVCRLIQADAFSNKGNVINGIGVHLRNGLFCVNTKISNRQDLEDFRSPVLLPHCHPLVERLIREEHLKNCHAGVQFLMTHLREKYWIIKSRKAIRKVTQSCTRCRRFKARVVTVPVAPLPEHRVKNARVFEVTGVDLAGPLYVKDQSKVWIVLFTCAVYRGIHLELVTSLNTDSFLMALFRFISRRGRPSIIYSDNGTNFVGAVNLFKMMDWNRIELETRVQRIQWFFNPPSAAWWGGWWERLIQSVKDLLRKMLGHKKLCYVQLETALCEVEAVINSRPLTYVTEDPEDFVPLTPSMFWQDLRETSCPEVQTLDAIGFRKKYRDFVQLKQELRHRFRTEYLGLLVQKGKQKPAREFHVGEVVLIASDNRKRLEWPLARIIELIPGKDGKIRLGRVKTSSGELLRPLQRLVPLEVIPEDIPVPEEVKVRAAAKFKKVKVLVPEPEVTTRRGRKIMKPDRLGF